MKKDFAITIRPAVSVFSKPQLFVKNDKAMLVSNIADECMYGTACRVNDTEEGWSYITTSYGYSGYVQTSNLLFVSESSLRQWTEDQVITAAAQLDILSADTVHGVCLISLPAGSMLQLVQQQENGWSRIRLADGNEAFAASNHLAVKRFDDSLLWDEPGHLICLQEHAVENQKTETGGKEGFCLQNVLDRWFEGSETLFRRELVRTASSYLGTQYRWGGRSSLGIDCSGLVHMSYLRCGISVYRDASIVRDYPLKKIGLKFKEGRFDPASLDDGTLLPGDCIYFPGHVAIYLNDGLYIHSTGKSGSMGVVINSLRPGHELFREDLLEKLYAAAGVRTEQ